MTARDMLITVLEDSDLYRYDVGAFADAILAIVPEICGVCARCKGDGRVLTYDPAEPPLMFPGDTGGLKKCESCNGTGIRIKQEQREGEDGLR